MVTASNSRINAMIQVLHGRHVTTLDTNWNLLEYRYKNASLVNAKSCTMHQTFRIQPPAHFCVPDITCGLTMPQMTDGLAKNALTNYIHVKLLQQI